MGRYDVSADRLKRYYRDLLSWVHKDDKKRTAAEIEVIDNFFLEKGGLSLEDLLGKTDYIVRRVIDFTDKGQEHFERRMEEWYKDAIPEYQAYIKKIEKEI